MSDSITPEQHQPNEREKVKVRSILLGEEVPLFVTENTGVLQSPAARDLGVSQVFHSQVELKISDSLIIPIGISAHASRSRVGNSVTPFHPENGYPIDQRDFNLDERMQKRKELGKRLEENIDIKKDPLHLAIEASLYRLNDLGINTKHDFASYKFPPEMLALFKRLRVQLVFPGSEGTAKPGDADYRSGSSFESKIWNTSLIIGQISFKDFYPTDTGELAAKEDTIYRLSFDPQEGLNLFVPSNLELLKKVKVKFFLTEQKEQLQEPIPEEPTPQEPSAGGGFIRRRD